jgi:hypothetical protein
MRKILLVLAILLGFVIPAKAQDHTTLKMAWPKAAGASAGGAGLSTSNRINRAYQGLKYEFRAVCRGGHYPYTYSLSGEPSGMTIVASDTDNGIANTAGHIEWPNPQASDASITVTCMDQDGDTASATWGVTVSTTIGDDGFCFLDADSGSDSTGNGSRDFPYASLAKIKDAADLCSRAIIYLRGAPENTQSYHFGNGFTLAGNTAELREDAGEPVILIGYPGDAIPIIDNDDHNPGTPLNEIFLRGSNIWIQDIHHRDAGLHGFNLERSGTTNGYGSYFWRVTFTGGGPGVNGSNTAYVFYEAQEANPSYHDVMLNLDVSDINYGNSFNLNKSYSQIEPIFSDIEIYNVHDRTGEADGLFSIKDSVVDYTIRNSKCSGLPSVVPCIGGSQNAAPLAVRGEVHHNNIITPGGVAIHHAEFGNTTATYHYNNTIQGIVRIGSPGSVDTGEGPFTFTRDVMVNSSSTGGSCPARLTCANVTDLSVLSVDASVVLGADDGTIVSTTTGLLQGQNLIDYGPDSATPRGHQLGAGGGGGSSPGTRGKGKMKGRIR